MKIESVHDLSLGRIHGYTSLIGERGGDEDCSQKRPLSTPHVDSQGRKRVYQPQGPCAFTEMKVLGDFFFLTAPDFSIFETSENMLTETNSFLHVEALSLPYSERSVPKFNRKLLL